MRTSCGETTERRAAFIHGLAAAVEALITVYHIISIFTHRRRDRAQRLLGQGPG